MATAPYPFHNRFSSQPPATISLPPQPHPHLRLQPTSPTVALAAAATSFPVATTARQCYPCRRYQPSAHRSSSPTLISRPPLPSLPPLPTVGPTLLSSAHLPLAALSRTPSFLLIYHRPTLLILMLSVG
ncbi:hypothetical protein BHE74_00011570 [Ensete ventricosum]|nr:hypothetical protein BHE74_00011570 [Ensete ventricosum]RZS03262.1 hypothetical protein BHM03_00033421 [Ensete ventricosum]